MPTPTGPAERPNRRLGKRFGRSGSAGQAGVVAAGVVAAGVVGDGVGVVGAGVAGGVVGAGVGVGVGTGVFSLAAAFTHALCGVPFWPATFFLLTPLQAWPGLFASPVASFAMAVTHWLNGVPFWPLTCFFEAPAQATPYALALSACFALGPGVGAGVVAGVVAAGVVPSLPCPLPWPFPFPAARAIDGIMSATAALMVAMLRVFMGRQRPSRTKVRCYFDECPEAALEPASTPAPALDEGALSADGAASSAGAEEPDVPRPDEPAFPPVAGGSAFDGFGAVDVDPDPDPEVGESDLSGRGLGLVLALLSDVSPPECLPVRLFAFAAARFCWAAARFAADFSFAAAETVAPRVPDDAPCAAPLA